MTPSPARHRPRKKLILKKTILQSWLSGKVLFVPAKLPPYSNRCLRTHLDTALYVIKREQKNSANYTQILHLILHLADLPCVTECIVCVSNYTQTIHKTLHCNPALQPYTKHRKEPTQEPCILFFWTRIMRREQVCCLLWRCVKMHILASPSKVRQNG